jgi:DNA-binding MarR family transcriptional regulator
MTDDDVLSGPERQLWTAIKRLSDSALSAVVKDLEAATALSGADFGILTRLEDLGAGNLAQADLLTALGWEKSRLSHQLARMEVRDLIVRRPMTGRGVMVCILPNGRTRIAAARPVHARSVREHVLQHISAAEGQILIDILARMDATATEAAPLKNSSRAGLKEE